MSLNIWKNGRIVTPKRYILWFGYLPKFRPYSCRKVDPLRPTFLGNKNVVAREESMSRDEFRSRLSKIKTRPRNLNPAVLEPTNRREYADTREYRGRPDFSMFEIILWCVFAALGYWLITDYDAAIVYAVPIGILCGLAYSVLIFMYYFRDSKRVPMPFLILGMIQDLFE